MQMKNLEMYGWKNGRPYDLGSIMLLRSCNICALLAVGTLMFLPREAYTSSDTWALYRLIVSAQEVFFVSLENF